MIRAVLDTNTLASGITFRGAPAGAVVTAWKHRRFQLVVSEHILDELSRTLEKRYFKKKLTKRERKSLLARIRRQALITEITAEVIGVASHPEDDLVLATAISAGASHLVTKDGGLLAVRDHGGVQVLRPEDFLPLL